MSYFGLNTSGQNQMLDTAASNPVRMGSNDVGMLDNMFGAAGAGIYSGLVAKPDQALWGALDATMRPAAKFVSDTFGVNDTSADFAANQRKLAEQQVRRLTPDAGTTGTAGQILYGLFDMGSQAVAGTLLGGPVGGAAVVSGLQGFSEFERLRADGVDVSTAQEVALAHGVTAGVGTLLPMSIGLRAGGALSEGIGAQLARTGESTLRNAAAATARAVPDVAYAAGTNVAMGMALRGTTGATLRKGGYEDMAAQYDVFDRQALAIDAVLGVAFGGIGRFINSRGESVAAPEFSRGDVDAALSMNAAQHAEVDIAPGVPVNVLSRNAHAQALQQAMRDLSQGRPVDVASITADASFNEIPGRRNLITQSINEALMGADEGSTARLAETRLLEEQASQMLSRGDRKVWESEVANSERLLENMNAERAEILSEQPAGSGRELSRARADKQARLRDVDQRIEYSTSRLRDARETLAAHEPGGTFFEARAEMARREQAAAELDARALSYYRTPDVNRVEPTNLQAAPLADTTRAAPAQAARNGEESGARAEDPDYRYAEETLASSPDMNITVIDADGNPQVRSARELLDEANRESEQAAQDASLYDVAVNCFLRG